MAVLDDDPTGAQEVADTPVVIDWTDEGAMSRLPDRPFHVLTNTRAHSGHDAYTITRSAATAVRQRFPEAAFLLRGDSTLRAHLLQEFEAVRDAAFPGRMPVLLLVPALPAAGRVTVGGIHLLERGGTRTPLHETEYARDGSFAYASARLLEWAEERSNGFFPTGDGLEIPLARLRALGAEAVHEALAALAAQGGPAVCAPDAETVGDLEAIADGLRAAQDDGIAVIVRCAPTFAAVYCRTLAPEALSVPRAQTLLVVCGSYVPLTTRQLDRLAERRPGTLVEIDLAGLIGPGAQREVARAAEAARVLLERERLAVIATPRRRAPVADDPIFAGAITDGLARLARLLESSADLVLFKGGITSAVGVRDGLGASVPTVEGPVRPGVALWRLEDGRQCLVFPGNVGGEEALAELVDEVLS